MSGTQSEEGAFELGELARSPVLYPQSFRPTLKDVLLIRMSQTDYRAASFLDDRILKRDTPHRVVPEAMVMEAANKVAPRPLHFIFHAGHVGSTLLSRLLDETGQVLSLREPLPLRVLPGSYDALARGESQLSEARLDAYLEMFLKLWSRGFADTRAIVVKATSASARLGPRLLALRADARAVYLNLAAEPYLATLLSSADPGVDLGGHAPERSRRLAKFLGEPFAFQSLTLGELAALSWLTERLTEKQLQAQMAARVLPLDFDHLLQDIKGTLARVTSHFELQVEPKYFEAIAQSPALTRYSKAPVYEYSPRLRAQILAETRAKKRDEIKRGLDWLEKLGAKHRDVAEVLNQKLA